jgi:uncharacterized protein YegL
MPKVKKIKQEIVVVIDSSGSMYSSATDVIGGFNQYISDLKANQDVNIKLSLITFDGVVNKKYSGKSIKDVTNICEETYKPRGSTALNDAVMEAINDVKSRLKKTKTPPQVIIVVFTDGEENSSTEFSVDDVKKSRAEMEEQGWLFIFMGADMDAWKASSVYGMSAGNTISLGKNAIKDSVLYLSNRTSKAAKLHTSFLTGDLSKASYATATQSLMALDDDDLTNDEDAVRLREIIDQSSNVKSN